MKVMTHREQRRGMAVRKRREALRRERRRGHYTKQDAAYARHIQALRRAFWARPSIHWLTAWGRGSASWEPGHHGQGLRG